LRLAIETRKLCRIKSMNHLREKLVLASSSPRRAEILERAGWPHEIIVAGIDETLFPDERAADYVQRLARSKAEAVASRLRQGLVLGADTTEGC
jgi:septum formation protein